MTSNVLPLHFAPSQASSSQNSNVDSYLRHCEVDFLKLSKTESSFQAWEDRKIQLTRQAKIHLMKQLKSDVNSQIQTLKSVNSLPEAKKLLQGLERNGFSDLTKRAAALSDDRIPESSETLGAIKLLQETMKVLKVA